MVDYGNIWDRLSTMDKHRAFEDIGVYPFQAGNDEAHNVSWTQLTTSDRIKLARLFKSNPRKYVPGAWS